jgi:hypothetical protein
MPTTPRPLDDPLPSWRAGAKSLSSQELSEDVVPGPGKPEIVLAPQEYIKVRKWHVTRVFYFLTGSSVLCLGAVSLVPKPAVYATAVAVLAVSAGLARFLLTQAYQGPGTTRPPAE